jgi:hypothetical protein
MRQAELCRVPRAAAVRPPPLSASARSTSSLGTLTYLPFCVARQWFGTISKAAPIGGDLNACLMGGVSPRAGRGVEGLVADAGGRARFLRRRLCRRGQPVRSRSAAGPERGTRPLRHELAGSIYRTWPRFADTSRRGLVTVWLQARWGLYFVRAWGLDAAGSDLSFGHRIGLLCAMSRRLSAAVLSLSSSGRRRPADGVACHANER